MAKQDPVNNPKHYVSDPSGIECIDITRHRNFNIGNAIKYLWRAGLKFDSDRNAIAKQIEDLNKAVWYMVDEIHRLKGRCTVKTDSITTCLPLDNESIVDAAMNYSKFYDGKSVTILGLSNNNETIKSKIHEKLSELLSNLIDIRNSDCQTKLKLE